MGSKQIGIRLNHEELQALRRIPGESDSARVRSLIHNQGITSGFATEITAALMAAVSEKLDQTESRLSMKINGVQVEPLFRKLVELLNPILAELLTNTRKIH